VGGIARPRSPDRIVSGHGLSLGGDKNEVEMMFEKFGIKAMDVSATESPPPDCGQGEVSPQSALSPSHLYNETSKLLAEFADGKSVRPATADCPPPQPPSKRKKSAPQVPDANDDRSIASEHHDTDGGKDKRKSNDAKASNVGKSSKVRDTGKSSKVRDVGKTKQEVDSREKVRGSSSEKTEVVFIHESSIDIGSRKVSESSCEPALKVKLYIEEPGESSSDNVVMGSSTDDVRGGGGDNWLGQQSSIITSQPRATTSDTGPSINIHSTVCSFFFNLFRYSLSC